MLLMMLLTTTTAWAVPTGNWADYKAASLSESADYETIYISTAAELALFAYNVNNDVQNAKGYYCARTVELLADIDLSEHYWTPIGTPIYKSGIYFNGKFNGNGHVITGMNITNNCATNFYGFVGHFRGQTNNPSHIDNLIFRDCHVTGNVPQNASGGVGTVVGFMNTSGGGAVTNCLVLDCSVTETNNVNSYNSHGAIIGYANSYTATNNYYYNMSGDYGAGMSKRSNNTDVTTDAEGARIAYAATLGDGVTATATTGIAYDGKFYTTSGTTVTLGHDREGYVFGGYASSDVTITNGAFTMPANDVTVSATWYAPTHEYTITAPATFNVTVGGNAATTAMMGQTVTLSAASGYSIAGAPTVTDVNSSTITVNDAGDGTYTFTMPESDVNVIALMVESGWKFVGTYKTQNFDANDTYYYGFVGTEGTGTDLGTFVQVGGYVRVKPMRAYLVAPGGTPKAAARRMTRAADSEDMPSTLRVRLLGSKGETTGIISIDNGQLKIDNYPDAWYTLDGRKLTGEPTQRGIYINKGKKVVIK